MTGALTLPAAYRPSITEPSARSTRACSSVTQPALGAEVAGHDLDRVERPVVDLAEVGFGFAVGSE